MSNRYVIDEPLVYFVPTVNGSGAPTTPSAITKECADTGQQTGGALDDLSGRVGTATWGTGLTTVQTILGECNGFTPGGAGWINLDMTISGNAAWHTKHWTIDPTLRFAKTSQYWVDNNFTTLPDSYIRRAGSTPPTFTITFNSDGSGAGSITGTFPALVVHYATGVTTVDNVRTLLARHDVYDAWPSLTGSNTISTYVSNGQTVTPAYAWGIRCRAWGDRGNYATLMFENDGTGSGSFTGEYPDYVFHYHTTDTSFDEFKQALDDHPDLVMVLQTVSGTQGPQFTTGANPLEDAINDNDLWQFRGGADTDQTDIVATGLAQTGAAGTITLKEGTTLGANDRPNGLVVDIMAGTGAGQTRRVYDWVESTAVASVRPNWSTNPDSTSRYRVRRDAGAIEDAGIAQASFAATPDVNVIQISGDTTAADNLEAQFDGTGLTGSTFPARQDSYEVRRNTAQAGSTGSTIVLDASASATNDFYNRTSVIIVGGTGAGQAPRRIWDYVGSTKTASVTPNWNTTPDATSVFVIIAETGVHLQTLENSSAQPLVSAASVGGYFPSDVYRWKSLVVDQLIGAGDNTGLPSADVINAGTAAAGAATTITLGTSTHGLIATSTVDDFYNGSRILIVSGTGAGQERIITDYVGSTKVATVDTAWITNPNATSKYVILAGGRQTTAALGTVSADVVSVSGDTTAADNLELQYDGTGLTGDNFPAKQSQVDALEGDSTTLLGRLTAARAGYLDNLNVGGLVASSAEATAIQNNTRVVRVVPDVIIEPDAGTRTYRVELLLYDDVGNMEAPDSDPTIALVNEAGTDRSSRLDSATMALVSTGRYRAIYTSTAGDAHEQLVWTFSVVEGGATRLYGNASSVEGEGSGGTVDANIVSISGDTTAADNLEAMYDGTGLTGDNFPAKQSQVDTVEASVARIQGLLHENARVDKQIYDSSNNLISARLRVFANKTAADASTAWNGSTPADNAEGEIQRYTITAAYSGTLLNSYKLVRDL